MISDFCTMCGYLLQDIGQVMCKACAKPKENQQTIKCSCEYCQGISFYSLGNESPLNIDVPKTSWILDTISDWTFIPGSPSPSQHDRNERPMIVEECYDQTLIPISTTPHRHDQNVRRIIVEECSDYSGDAMPTSEAILKKNDWMSQDNDKKWWSQVHDDNEWGPQEHVSDWSEGLVDDWGVGVEEGMGDDWGVGVDVEEGMEDLQSVSDQTQEIWKKEQNLLKKELILEDTYEVQKLRECIESGDHGNQDIYIGGMDISFVKGDPVNACAAFVILDYPDMKVVYEEYKMIKLTAPYIPGFLAFREADFLVDLYKNMMIHKPEYRPAVIFMDGNGILHPRGYGIACHVGVKLRVPCLGVAKHLMHIDKLINDEAFKPSKSRLKKGGDTVELRDMNDKLIGMALRTLNSAPNPVYVSPGHLVSTDTSVMLVKACCKYRVPEPVRQADLNSREYLRKNWTG